MTREIKFRAWDKKTKKIRKVNSIAFHTDESYGSGKTDNTPKVINLWGRDIIEDKDIILHREEDDVELMQYTGLKDKNGREIFEGDILEYDDGDEWVIGTEVVEFEAGAFNCACFHPHQEKFIADPRIIKVIGNIYENPELLSKD